MWLYIFKRLLLIIPTLFGILLINFLIIQSAPGGPVDQMIAKLNGHDINASSMITGTQSGDSSASTQKNINSTQANNHSNYHYIDPDVLADIQKLYGFDQPLHKRFFKMAKEYLQFDFGDSFFQDKSVIQLIKEKLPVSISLGLWSTLLIYLISIPLGIKKAVNHGGFFDVFSSWLIVSAYAIPGFLFAIMLIVLFAGGSYVDWFPLRGLQSENFEELSILGQIKDYFWHLALPLAAYTIGGFATLTMLTKNSFLDEIGKQYVDTAKAKGLNNHQILYNHVFRNAMLIIISGFPATFISMFFAGSLLIEIIFSLDGLGLLGYEAVINRDYPVIFATLFVFSFIGLISKLISDLSYILIDPRINFEGQK